jgi:ABC-type branched-subunit amino acid transport system ATPase component
LAILETKGLGKSFGSLKALSNVSFDVREKEILAVVGPNGSGKTTLFNVISKVLKPDQGEVVFDGHRIEGLPSHRIAHLGLARTFQVPTYFKSMTVEEQVFLASKFGGLNSHKEERISESLAFTGLSGKTKTPTDRLNIYEKKKLMLASALAMGPKAVMLDEPLAGLNNTEVAEELKLIAKVRERGITVMVIEHNIRAVFAWADRAMVMHRGEKLSEGSPSEVAKDAQVIQVYLGKGYF